MGASGEAHSVKMDEVLTSVALLVIQIFVVVAACTADLRVSTSLDAKEYGFFRDVSLMIFFGFGFLMTFLYRHGLSAIGYCLVISAVVVELSVVVEHLVSHGYTEVTIETLMNGLFCAGAVMISYGAVIGKVTPFQLVVMSVVEVFAFWANFRLIITEVGAHDVGGGMVIHIFGAYFGLAATWWVTKKEAVGHGAEKSSYSSDIFSLAGTIILWVLWPSFQAAVAGAEQRQALAMTNTFVSLCSSTIAFAVISRLLSGHKFNVVHMQNATLAGGVAMGVAGDMDMGLHGAMISGFLAGTLSCVGYAKVQPMLTELGLHDTCGVNNLHGMPGILGAVIGMVVTIAHGNGGAASPGPLDTMGFVGVSMQRQVYALLITLGVAMACGTVAGISMTAPLQKLGIFVPSTHYFSDSLFFEEAAPEEGMCATPSSKSPTGNASTATSVATAGAGALA
mmetsp:Transcript_147971/g.368765  ORF Transcript_147971/g.368765 Transcript_147971/m.368765 type:complete len:451 (+) Transcript_147971:55-1407(+)